MFVLMKNDTFDGSTLPFSFIHQFKLEKTLMYQLLSMLENIKLPTLVMCIHLERGQGSQEVLLFHQMG